VQPLHGDRRSGSRRAGPAKRRRSEPAPALAGSDGSPGVRSAIAVVFGLAVIATVAALDAVVDGRAIPLTAVLLGPLLASAVAGPALVAAVAAVAVVCAQLMAVHDGLTGVEGWARVVLVGVAGLASCLVALLRQRHERALARADQVATLSTTLQQGLLPKLRGSGAVKVSALYRPTGRDLVLGGDFVDVVAVRYASEGAVAFCVGDVTGHDAAAASLGASLRAGWRALALHGGDPADWLRGLHDLVEHEQRDDEKLATVCVGLLEPARRLLLVASAGHPRPVLLGQKAVTLDLDAGPPLGLPADLRPAWQTEAVALDRDFSLVIYTDGLVEGRRAPGSASRYGEESLEAWLGAETVNGRIAASALDRLVADVEAANGGALADDVALVVLSGSAARAEGRAKRGSAGPAGGSDRAV
jgi:serine phosphatase RsbU (regulator of sigma subunit)